MQKYIMPTVTNLHSSLYPLEIDTEFKMDSATLHLIRVNKFNSFPSEDPNAHLRMFKDICDNYQVRGVSQGCLKTYATMIK